MAKRKRKRRPTSYSWALDPGPTYALSDEASDGLDYAAALAEDAQYRRHHIFSRDPQPPLSIDEIAETYGRSPAAVRRCINRARKELYGTLSDAGIYYRRRRRKHLAERPDRTCTQPGCTHRLPRDSSAGRTYCDTHRSPAARTARSRAKQAA